MVALLVLITLALTIGKARGQLGHEQRQFTAYDCTSPQELKAVTKGEPPQCQDRLDQEPIKQRNQTYLLLQKATYRRQPVSRCKVIRTRMAHHCGDSDHQTYIPQFSTFRAKVTISAGQCKEMYDREIYKDKWHEETPIGRGKTTIIRKELVGSTNPYGGADTQCVGATYRSKGIDIPDIMIWEELTITLDTDTLLVDKEGACIVNNDQIRIGCRDTDLSCIYSGGTLFWTAPTELEKCRYHQIRRSTGIVVTGSNGTDTFISRDGSMIRLILRRPAQLCGEATGFRTNYDNLYLMDEIYKDQVSTTLPLGEVSTITYANQQDGFLFGEMSAHVKAEFGALLEFNCRQEQHRERSPLGSRGTEERPHMDGYTVALEEGWFLTYAGELMYHYSCRPIIVVGRDDDVCYSALPIDLVVEDQKRIAVNRGEEEGNGTTSILTHAAGYFLEPHTRRLTFWGTHMPCVRNFAGAYLNTRGSWVVALPHLMLMETPVTLLEHERLEYTQGKLRVYDPASGGIYDKEMVREMEQFSQTRRLTNNVGTVLAEQGSRFQDPSHISPHDLWQEIPVVSFNFLGWLGDLLDHWGTALAAITLLLVCFKALSFISGLVARCLAAHRIWGCQFHLLAAVLPSVLQWMAIQLGLRGVWPAIQEDDPADQGEESFLTHARKSVMRGRISKKTMKKGGPYRDDGTLAEMGVMGVGRNEPTGCDSIITIHEAESFRIPDSFKVVPLGSPRGNAAQLAQVHNENEQSPVQHPVYHPMYVAGNRRLQECRAGLRQPEEMLPGADGPESVLYPDVRHEFVVDETPTAPGRTESAASGSYENPTLERP